jgi:hypothetical protein
MTGACGTGKQLIGVRARPQRRAPSSRFSTNLVSPAAMPLSAPVPQPLPNPAVDPRPLGSGTHDRRAAPGPEIVEDRYGRASTLLTSQLRVSRWRDVVGEPALADAIFDRIVHRRNRWPAFDRTRWPASAPAFIGMGIMTPMLGIGRESWANPHLIVSSSDANVCVLHDTV